MTLLGVPRLDRRGKMGMGNGRCKEVKKCVYDSLEARYKGVMGGDERWGWLLVSVCVMFFFCCCLVCLWRVRGLKPGV